MPVSKALAPAPPFESGRQTGAGVGGGGMVAGVVGGHENEIPQNC